MNHIETQLQEFTPAMIAGCNAALDAKVFYQDEFCDFVLEHMGGPDCTAGLVSVMTLDVDAEGYWEQQRAVSQELTALISSAPRGQYALIRRLSAAHGERFSLLVSDGKGIATGGKFNGYDSPPSGAKVLERMIGYEIYCCRKVLEDQRRIAADVAAFQQHQFAVGMEFKDYKHPGEKPFSKVVIQDVVAARGQVKLFMVRRGSKKRYEVWVGAKVFAERVKLQAPMSDGRPPFIVIVQNGESSHA